MAVLVLNCGSSSAKYQLYDWERKEVLLTGVVERIGQDYSTIEQKARGKETFSDKFSSPTHTEAISLILKMICDKEYGAISNLNEIDVVGHRVLHGGEAFKASVLVDDDVLSTLRTLIPLGPLHEKANITGIEVTKGLLPNIKQAIVIDTTFHQTMPKEAFLYAVPKEWYEKYNVRRYGFHGTSHLYCSKRAAVLLGKENKDTNVIICHIGNGASLSAVKNGICVDTSMGLTPLEGLVMGTRSGDLDPAIIPYMQRMSNLSADEIDNILNKKSGLYAICGKIDRRDVEKAANSGDEDSKLAMAMEARRIKKYIGSYMALLGKVDAIVFTAGVGEFGSTIRKMVLENMTSLGVVLDENRNALARSRNGEFTISAADSRVKVFVIPTDEELVITEDAKALQEGIYDVHTKFKYSFESKDYVNKERAEKLHFEFQNKPELEKVIAINSWH